MIYVTANALVLHRFIFTANFSFPWKNILKLQSAINLALNNAIFDALYGVYV